MSPPRARPRPRERRRLLRRVRRLLAALLCALPMIAFVVTDLGRRSERLARLDGAHRGSYAFAALSSLVVWALLLHAASRRRGASRHLGAALFVLAATFAHGGQTYFHDHWNTYLSSEAAVFTKDFWGSVVMHHLADIGGHLRAMAPALAVSLALVVGARRWIRASRRTATIALTLAVAAISLRAWKHGSEDRAQAATPDVLWFEATGSMVAAQFELSEDTRKDRPRVRSPRPVPALAAPAGEKRNVLFVLLESMRADAVCIEHDADCAYTPHTNTLLPGRFPFTQMRSLDSTTVISTVVLFNGLGPHEDRETLHEWPWLFDYARAAGYHTAYWTSQDVMFGNLFLWRHGLGESSYVSARELDPEADPLVGPPEDILAERVKVELASLEEPFFAVLHLSNTHFPYYVNRDLPQPFQPARPSNRPGDAASFRRHYQNAVWQEDMHLAGVLRALRASEAGKRTAIVYTADHGEAFHERGQTGHIFSIFDEEIHVPAWIDVPPGWLSPAEVEALRDKKDAPVFHVDVAPTILDLMGIWEEPGLSSFKSRMPGTSLLRPERTTRPLLMTNCSALWTCAYENWGAMQGTKKLFARAWDQSFRCYDVAADPDEKEDLGADSCRDLLDLTLGRFGRMPSTKN